jgi:FkbM family methyltransferase
MGSVKTIVSLAAKVCERSDMATSLLRSIPVKGKGRILNHISAEWYQKEVTARCSGLIYRLDLRDLVQRQIYFNIYDRREVSVAVNLTPVGGTCIDAGANQGAFALPMSRKVGAKGIVHAFEADSTIFKRLVLNSKLNGLDNVLKCHNLAISNTETTVTFHRAGIQNSGWGTLASFEIGSSETERVRAVSLDTFVGERDIKRVDFLKADIEAYEPELLAGARKSLEHQVFRHILIECNGTRLSQRGISFADLLDPLWSAGYRPDRLNMHLFERIREGSIDFSRVCTSFLFSAG